MDTLDAGTDNGFTFTSPNWPTEPQGTVYRLSHNVPNHPASSFYYPGVKKLPTMASFQFIKVRSSIIAAPPRRRKFAFRHRKTDAFLAPDSSPLFYETAVASK